MQMISILQANCSAINELLLDRPDKIVSNIDFCKLKNLTPGILTGILALTNFTGYTGPISFSSNVANLRKSTYLIHILYLNLSS